MAWAFISIGSNIDPEANVKNAVLRLAQVVRVFALSTVYRTDPVGPPGQPFYYNCAVKIETDLPPRELKFKVLRRIESELGRIRGSDKFAARAIDLDLVLYDNVLLSEADLMLPDPDIGKRPFLAIPLAELEPGLVLPGSGLCIRDAAASLAPNTMKPLHPYTDCLRKELFHERKQ